MSEDELIDEEPLTWSPPVENIENIVEIKLTQSEQKALNCTVNKNIFLEYPWAFINRFDALKVAGTSGSSLEIYKDKIKNYKTSDLLIGYNSKELYSNNFIICLTEETKKQMIKRNCNITKNIRKHVKNMLIKEKKNNKIDDKNNYQVTEILINRPFIEIEINQSVKNNLLTNRNSDECRDSFIEIYPSKNEKFDNITMKLITESVQTTLLSIDKNTQTYFGYKKNKWTQYDDLIDTNIDEGIEKPDDTERQTNKDESSSTTGQSEIVNEEKEVVVVNYNSQINMHTDDILNLGSYESNFTKKLDNNCYDLIEDNCLINLELTNGRFISDISWHPNISGIIVISYVENSRNMMIKNTRNLIPNYTSVCALVWSLCDSLKPKIILKDYREVQVISFCPSRPSVIIGGCTNGQIVMWDLNDQLDNINDQMINRISSTVESDIEKSHLLSIRSIEWLPSYVKLDDNGKLVKLVDTISMQFMTASEDGTICIWDLNWQQNLSQVKNNLKNIVTIAMTVSDNIERLDKIFCPNYYLHVQSSTKDLYNSIILHMCLPSTDLYDNLSLDCDELPRRIWVSTVIGEIYLITWQGQDYEPVNFENINIICKSSVIHDGPITKIIRNKFISNLLLTIGGHVFSIWNDENLVSLLWRKCDVYYTDCCWSNTPGVFILSRQDGYLETWDIYCKTCEPVHVQTISGKLITGLYTQDTWNLYSKYIGVCDYNGAFKIYKETKYYCSNNHDRIEWLKKFIKREIERKMKFIKWQFDYLNNNQIAIERKKKRIDDEVKKKHQEARDKFIKEQEEISRLKADKKIKNIKKTKDTIRKLKNIEFSKTILLDKKKFDPVKLDLLRLPLVEQQNEKISTDNSWMID
ncbi:dynein axonemal intermediate chain 3-like [Aphidius gifuensis]|uniref:dynein axonemal intermediate chain 3-like n=1 Tax=Aphidius gifuensis TaxID=684658 RepID=UPI001CDC40C4|nr:dynein axonemal intermediate chain 3-like [Aphidius gifuensis]